ncbi:hypothetical protein CPLU01_08063 [Colletotrichum plurivorum]|uniref:Ankyrin repeat protein n=1 Tax=Colletotrichum plurivorum TaxID=2175906 RepID=A0A8H6NDR6_9PEZI|nr:hypothetical protein CPLU01_08063 [Colletotrichum plurivorum]
MATNGYDPVQQAFESAKRDFKSNLKQEELYRQILETTSIEQVYDATDKLQNEQAKTGHLRNLSKIDVYMCRLREYGRIFDKVNRTDTLRKKARRILGWISCAPSPLTRREIEHALFIDPEDTDGEARVVSVLDVVRAHHDPELSAEEVGFNLRAGAYRFHDFASLFWLELLRRFLVLNETTELPEDLLGGLENLYEERYRLETQASAESQGSKGEFGIMDPQQAHLQHMLKSVSGFQKIADNADYHLGRGQTTNLAVHAQPFGITAGQDHSSVASYTASHVAMASGLGTLETITRSITSNLGNVTFPGSDHQPEGTTNAGLLGDPDEDEIQPLLFDLVGSNNLEAVKALSPRLEQLPCSVREELVAQAAAYGSSSMLDLLWVNLWGNEYNSDDVYLEYRALLDAGAEVDFKLRDSYCTPLQYAARNKTEAARLMEFFLSVGANPKTSSNRRKLEDEEGVRQIST